MTESRRRLVALVVVVAVVGGLFGWLAVRSSGDGGSAGGDALPVVDVVDGNGETISTASFVGTPLVVNFWFSSCAPCAQELRDFAEVEASRGDEVRFIGVNPLDTPEEMQVFASERGVRYELVRDELAELQDRLGITAFPATIFVTSDGTIVERTGVLDAGGLDRAIDELLDAERAG